MHRPAHLAAAEEWRFDRLEDLASASAALRKAVLRGDRVAVETFCGGLLRRLALAPLEDDDADEIRAMSASSKARVRFGPCAAETLPLPLVTAIERQIEEAEQDLA